MSACIEKKVPKNASEEQPDYKMILVSEQATLSGPLASIKSYNNIILSQTDFKCGEFGGDTVIMKIYGDESNTKLLLDYKKIVVECAENPNPKSQEKNKIEITQKEKQLIQDCISDLVLHKISTEGLVTNYGYYNEIISEDSTLTLNDFASFDWPKFQELTKIMEIK